MEAQRASSSTVVLGSSFGGSATAYGLAETPPVDEVGIPLG